MRARSALAAVSFSGLDSMVCRTQQRAAGARKDGDGQRESLGGTRPEPLITGWAAG
jgi:hypothetical protein